MCLTVVAVELQQKKSSVKMLEVLAAFSRNANWNSSALKHHNKPLTAAKKGTCTLTAGNLREVVVSVCSRSFSKTAGGKEIRRKFESLWTEEFKPLEVKHIILDLTPLAFIRHLNFELSEFPISDRKTPIPVIFPLIPLDSAEES